MQPEREALPESDDDIDEARDTIEQLEQSVARPPADDEAPDEGSTDHS